MDVNFSDWVHVYVDAALEPEGRSGVAFDFSGKCVGCLSEVVSPALVDLIKRKDQETIILELEGLAVAVALHSFRDILKGRRVVIFTDNESVQSCLVKCKSNNDHMNLIIRSICSLEDYLGLVAWIDRVPFAVKPCSGIKLSSFGGKVPTAVDLEAMWHLCLAEKLKSASSVGE